jgi:hypothetical protein
VKEVGEKKAGESTGTPTVLTCFFHPRFSPAVFTRFFHLQLEVRLRVSPLEPGEPARCVMIAQHDHDEQRFDHHAPPPEL